MANRQGAWQLKRETEDERDREKVQRQMEDKRRRLQRPFVQTMVNRLFLLFLVVEIGFGAYDGWRLLQGTPGLTAVGVFGSLAAAGLLIGLPLIAACSAQLWRISHGRTQGEPGPYKWRLIATAGIVAAVLVAWGASLPLA